MAEKEKISTTDLQKKLISLSDENYRNFQAPLIPNVSREYFIGVRTPQLKELAKEVSKNYDCSDFLKDVPHQYFDENQLHAFILNNIKDFDECITKIEAFLPFINNWATCDQCSPLCFKKNKSSLLPYIREWISSGETYKIRFGIKCLMQHFLDEEFESKYLEEVSRCCRPHLKNADDNYYINMMVSWYFATALAKQWKETFEFLKSEKVKQWCLKKTVQKARESFRISEEQKKILKETFS